ncbi:hypothetical protein ACCO45_010458 [Purpureocillium lilacinum]|uniref:Uncharacterized protein n=1 Tax=Purpureocillium lilacinum TaxID=33203 RepID=A0ACC4DEV3_PURLI
MPSLRTREGDGPAQLSRPLCKRGVVSSSEFHLYEAQRPDAVLHAALVSRLTDEMARAVTTPGRQKQGHGKTKKYRGYSKPSSKHKIPSLCPCFTDSVIVHWRISSIAFGPYGRKPIRPTVWHQTSRITIQRPAGAVHDADMDLNSRPLANSFHTHLDDRQASSDGRALGMPLDGTDYNQSWTCSVSDILSCLPPPGGFAELDR